MEKDVLHSFYTEIPGSLSCSSLSFSQVHIEASSKRVLSSSSVPPFSFSQFPHLSSVQSHTEGIFLSDIDHRRCNIPRKLQHRHDLSFPNSSELFTDNSQLKPYPSKDICTRRKDVSGKVAIFANVKKHSFFQ